MEENNENNVQDKLDYSGIDTSSKNRLTAMVLCILFGFLGVHRLYAGKIGTGFLFAYCTIVTTLILFVNVPIGLMCLVALGAAVANDFVVLAFGQFYDCYGKLMTNNEVH